MPPSKATDSDDGFEESDDDSVALISDSDSDEDFQIDTLHRSILGRPHTKIYDSSDYVSAARGMANRSGLDARRLQGTDARALASGGMLQAPAEVAGGLRSQRCDML